MWYVVVALVSYALFVFTAERLNPLRRPDMRSDRRTWRLGRQLALIMLVSGVAALVSFEQSVIASDTVLQSIVAISVVMLAATVRRYRKSRASQSSTM